MMNSKDKGNTFERKISNLLSERFKDHTGIAHGFRRNSDSGSYFGGANHRRTSTHDIDKASFGDIICPKDFKFSIECKHYKTPPSTASIIKQEYAQFDKWIAQGQADASSAGKTMLVIAKFNNIPEIVIVESCVTSLIPVMTYKGFSIVPLDKFLAQDVSYFFGLT